MLTFVTPRQSRCLSQHMFQHHIFNLCKQVKGQRGLGGRGWRNIIQAEARSAPGEPWTEIRVYSRVTRSQDSHVLCVLKWMWLQQVFSLWHPSEESLLKFLCAFPILGCISQSRGWRLKLTFLICSASPCDVIYCTVDNNWEVGETLI